jgi:hypothetical protein
MTRQLLQALLCSIILTNSVAAHPADVGRITASLETLRESVNQHDYSLLEPALAVNFTYQGNEPGMSQMIMQQVVAGFSDSISAINVVSVSESVDAWEVAVSLETARDSKQKSIRLNKDYLVLQADIADIQLGGHAPAALPPQKAISEVPAVTTVPFTLAKNLIVVKAEINGIFGNYIVDTGAQAVVLNRVYFGPDDIETVEIDHAPPSGVNGDMQGVKGAVNLALKWDAIQIEGLRGIAMDLSHLEKSIGIPVAGLIGFNVLERFQIHFDYAAQDLTLYLLGDDFQPLVQSHLGPPTQVTQFEMASHIPVFPVEIAGNVMRMGLDSGAGEAMLFKRWQETLEGQYEFLERTQLGGGDTNVVMGDVVRIDNMQVQGIDYPNITFRFNDIAAHDDEQLPMDGLLGYEFLKTRPTAINFRTRQLLIWPKS